MNQRIPPVVLNLIILNVIVYIVTNMLFPALGPYLALHYPAHGGFFQPYQLVTYMFQHDPNFWSLHLVINMLILWMFGSQIEQVWGGKKFLFFYIVCGLGAAGFNLGIDYFKVQHFTDLLNSSTITIQQFHDKADPILYGGMLGASGAIFGILAAFGMLFPNQMLMLLFPPIPMKAKYLVIGYAALELFSGISSSGDNIAHFAHLGGGLTGLIMLLYWRQRGQLFGQL